MAEKTFNSRIIHKHDVEKNWKKATNFTPMVGEIIIYDRDDNVVDEALRGTYSYERFKIGDGIRNVNSLPFEATSNLNTLVGESPVSEQIAEAIEAVTADDFGIYVQPNEPENAVAGDIWIDTISDPEYVAPTIPKITAADNGKVLMVVNGTLQLVKLNMSIDANGVVSM